LLATREHLQGAALQAAFDDCIDLAQALFGCGRLTPDTLSRMLTVVCTCRTPFNQEFAEYLISTCGVSDVSNAVWGVTTTSQPASQVTILEFLRRVSRQWNWSGVMNGLLHAGLTLLNRAPAIAHVLSQHNCPGFNHNQHNFPGFKHNEVRFPQQGARIVALAEQAVPLATLRDKVGGMHKFTKDLHHRHLLVRKHLRKPLPSHTSQISSPPTSSTGPHPHRHSILANFVLPMNDTLGAPLVPFLHLRPARLIAWRVSPVSLCFGTLVECCSIR
jgi:hypothetical protein